MLTLSPLLARRLAIARQRLAGPRPPADASGILEVARDLSCLQLDPISVVARSHLLVVWSRLGPFDPSHLDTLLWSERRLFEDWAHGASIVLTEDYPIFRWLQARRSRSGSVWMGRVQAWMKKNAGLRRHILTELRRRGPLMSRDLEDRAVSDWRSTGWTAGRNVDRMLAFLWREGRIMVAGRKGGQRLWDLTERCLPPWTPRDPFSEREAVRRAAQKALRALGVAQPRHIEQHYVRGGYPRLDRALADLEAEDRIRRVEISKNRQAWPGPWYIHTDDLPLLDRLAAGEWQPRTTLLSPFDNLICDRARTELLFNFKFTMEIYVPARQRRYGYYVMPILHGDRLIGRIDQRMDRTTGRLAVNAVHAEPDTPRTPAAGRAVAGTIEELAEFLKAKDVVYGRRMPAAWRQALR